MRARGLEVSPLGLARAYAPWLSRLVIDERDWSYARELTGLGLDVVVTDTLMTSGAREIALARRVLDAP
jgi:hypothetical protein